MFPVFGREYQMYPDLSVRVSHRFVANVVAHYNYLMGLMQRSILFLNIEISQMKVKHSPRFKPWAIFKLRALPAFYHLLVILFHLSRGIAFC